MGVQGSTAFCYDFDAAATGCNFGLASAMDFGGNGVRYGEATHPGPSSQVWIGCTNPTGLRGKEAILADFGPGIWHASETQLSQVTAPATKAVIRSLGILLGA